MKMFFCVWEGKTCRFARIIVSSWSRRSNTRYCGYHVKVLTLVKKKKKKNESGWIVLAQSPSFCFIGCLEAVYIGGYFNSVDNAEKERELGVGRRLIGRSGSMKSPGWLFVGSIVVRTLGKQWECLKWDINSVCVPVWLKQVQYIYLPPGLARGHLTCFYTLLKSFCPKCSSGPVFPKKYACSKHHKPENKPSESGRA